MLTDEDIKKIREKMKKNYIYCATLARRFGVTRQAIHQILKRRTVSKNIEEKLQEFLYGD